MVRKQKIEKTSKNSFKCMVLQLGQNITVFGHFLKFLLSNHPKTNTDPHSTPQDSTLDTPQGGVWTTFFTQFSGCRETLRRVRGVKLRVIDKIFIRNKSILCHKWHILCKRVYNNIYPKWAGLIIIKGVKIVIYCGIKINRSSSIYKSLFSFIY